MEMNNIKIFGFVCIETKERMFWPILEIMHSTYTIYLANEKCQKRVHFSSSID